MGLTRIRKPRRSIQRPAPNDADIGSVLLPSPSAAFCDARLSESPPAASQLAWDLLECLRTSLTPQERDSAAIVCNGQVKRELPLDPSRTRADLKGTLDFADGESGWCVLRASGRNGARARATAWR